MAKYQIKFKSTSVEKAWFLLERDIPEPMGKCLKFLEESPLDRLKSQGKLKKLKGKLQGLLQYDVTHSDRLRYKVDIKENIVFIEYIGQHP